MSAIVCVCVCVSVCVGVVKGRERMRVIEEKEGKGWKGRTQGVHERNRKWQRRGESVRFKAGAAPFV